MISYAVCALFKTISVLMRIIPNSWSLFFGRRIGDCIEFFDFKRRTIVMSNLRTAFGNELSYRDMCTLRKRFFRCLGQNLIEIFFLPFVDAEYLKRYLTIEGKEHIDEAFKKGTGVIFAAVHAGSWELSNVICSNLGFTFNVVVRRQHNEMFDSLLNSYRKQKGCRIIERKNQTRQLIEALKRNEAIGITIDQGGKTGALVDFFAQPASMAQGAIKLALKYDSVVLPAFYVRTGGPHVKLIIGKPFELIRTQDYKQDIDTNLQKLIKVFESYIRLAPQEYLWLYKIWKYSNQKRICILSDNKAGHQSQSQALAKFLEEYEHEQGHQVITRICQIRLKSKIHKFLLHAGVLIPGVRVLFTGQWFLRFVLDRQSCNDGMSFQADYIISCATFLSPINLIIAKEMRAKSLVIMKPFGYAASRFDAVFIPRHDKPRVEKRIVITDGALNVISEEYLKDQREKLQKRLQKVFDTQKTYCALFIGGDSKQHQLDAKSITDIIREVKAACDEFNLYVLVTTSRRTSKEVEEIVASEFKDFRRSELVVIANKENFPEVTGGLLCACSIALVSADSISMVSEAASSNRYVGVYADECAGPKHKRFIDYCVEQKYVYRAPAGSIKSLFGDLLKNRPALRVLDNASTIKAALKRLV